MTSHLTPVEITDRDDRTIRDQKVRPVFLNNEKGPFAGDQAIREEFWRVHLKEAGVRYQGPNNARYTFISQMLSTGVVPIQWIAAHCRSHAGGPAAMPVPLAVPRFMEWLEQSFRARQP
ncbi:hypothetical protein GCM10027040_23760 [Halomonas shantousis]